MDLTCGTVVGSQCEQLYGATATVTEGADANHPTMLLGWSAWAIQNGTPAALACTSPAVLSPDDDTGLVFTTTGGQPCSDVLGYVDASVVFAADYSSVSVIAVAYITSPNWTETWSAGAIVVDGHGPTGTGTVFVPAPPPPSTP